MSQKQAAAALHISQALLSHYENGIRECGLDFIVRTADFYQVSCDYLLGRSAQPNGAMLSIEDLPDPDTSDEKVLKRRSVLPTLNKKLMVHSLHIMFDMLQKIDNKEIVTEASNLLMLTIYRLFRLLYQINPKNEVTLFRIAPQTCSQRTCAASLQCEARLADQLQKLSHKKEATRDPHLLYMSTEALEEEYQQFHISLLNLIKTAENNITALETCPNTK